MNIELVVFDMAGTTFLDNGNINEAFREAFLTAGIKVNAADVNKVMGYKKIEAVKIIVDNQKHELIKDPKVVNSIHDRFIKNMINFYDNNTELQPLPFALDTFQQLKDKGIKVALNTGFTRSIANAVLNKLGWNNSPLIDATICSDEVTEGRPYPFMIQSLMNKLMIKNSGAVAKVGDTEVDVKEGRNAGCGLVVAVTTGAYSRTDLEKYKPDFVIDSLKQLLPLIK